MNEYAIYRGDELLVMGTKKECAERLNVKPDTIRFYCTPVYHRRIKQRKNPHKCIIGERIEVDECL